MLEIEHLGRPVLARARRCRGGTRPSSAPRRGRIGRARSGLSQAGIQKVFSSSTCARAPCRSVSARVGAVAPQAAGLAEHVAPAGHQPAAHRLLHRAQIGQDRELRAPRRADAREPLHVERRDSGRPALRASARSSASSSIASSRSSVCSKRGGGKIFLALEIIGHAGGVEPDAARDIGEGHALRALFVDRFGGRGEDRVALRLEALGALLRRSTVARLPSCDSA